MENIFFNLRIHSLRKAMYDIGVVETLSFHEHDRPSIS